MTNKGISVIIPNYNGRKLLPQILPPLFTALHKTNLPFEVIITDDNSSDESVAFIQSSYPDIQLIANSENLGFSPSVNQGAALAKFDYLLLLNNDVILTENYFEPLFRYFEKEDTFGVMGRIVEWNTNVIQDGAKYPSSHATKIKMSGNYYLKNSTKNDWLYSIYLSGANALLDRKKFLQLGGLDTLFAPYYIEDYELSIRAWRLGWKCYYDHFAICRHKTSATIHQSDKKQSIKKIYNRNKMYFHYIHLADHHLFTYFSQLFFESILSVFLFRWDYLRSIGMFLSTLKHAKKSKYRFFVLSQEMQKPLISLKSVTDKVMEELSGKDVHFFS